MAKELSKKLTAFNQLMKIAAEGSFDLYATSGDIYGERAWPVECFESLRKLKYSKTMIRQLALDETLMNLTKGDFPKTVQEMRKEQEMIRLTLLAGANPNYSDSYRGTVFNAFWRTQKAYGLLELVQDDRFESPNRLQDFYANNYWHPVYCSSPEEEQKVAMQDNANRDEVIYTLFQKNMYPTNPKVFEKLSPIVLEKDPQFFEKKKQEVQHSLVHAKTPIQIYSALMGKRKEKN